MTGKSTVLVAVLAGALLSGRAGAFSVQVDVGYATTDVDALPGDGDIKTTTVGATYYFSGIRNDRNPHDLQPFFQRAPSAQVLYTNPEYAFMGMELGVLDVNAELFMAPPVDGLSFRPHFLHNTMEMPPLPSVSVDTWGLDIGFYALDELKITLPGAVVGYLDEADGDLVENDASFKELMVEYALRAQGQDTFLTADCRWNVDSEIVSLSLGGTYYASRELGVGLTLALYEVGTGLELGDVAFEVSYWANGMARLGAGLTFHTDDSPFGEATTIGLSLAARF